MMSLGFLDLLMHLDNALGDEERAAREEDDVAPGDFAGIQFVQEGHRREREDRLGESEQE